MTESKNGNDKSECPLKNQDLQKLLKLLETVDYGSVTLVIQNGKVVQIEKNEKLRLK